MFNQWKKMIANDARALPIIIFFISFLLRSWNIGADLPNLYYPDEPHHLHVAAHFGTGDLNPHDFKYPTLWSYLLSILLGLMFAFGKLFGLTRSSFDFASSFFHSPTPFYLAARLLSAAFFSLSASVLYCLGRKYYDRTFAITISFLLILSPALCFLGRDATLFSVMIFFISCALYSLHDLCHFGRLKDYVLSGLFVGLSISSLYIAAPVAVLIPALYWLNKNQSRQPKFLVLALAFVGLGFLLGTPYFLLDFAQAKSDLLAMSQLHVSVVGRLQNNELASRPQEMLNQLIRVGKNFIRFLDPWGLGFTLMCVGLFLKKNLRERFEALVWVLPTLFMALLLTKAYHGDYYRYSLGAYIPLLIPAAMGFKLLWTWCGRIKIFRTLLVLLVFVPFSWKAFTYAKALGEPDTRTLARQWILDHVPQGEKIFLMYPYNCPQLLMDIDQTKSLLKRAQAAHHPREHFYRALLNNHPGGGYTIYYWRRNLNEIEDTPRRTELSYAAQDTVDMNKEGVDGLLREKINTAVLLTYPNYNDPAWFSEISNRFKLVKSFDPKDGEIKGSMLRIYQNTQE